MEEIKANNRNDGQQNKVHHILLQNLESKNFVQLFLR